MRMGVGKTKMEIRSEEHQAGQDQEYMFFLKSPKQGLVWDFA